MVCFVTLYAVTAGFALVSDLHFFSFWEETFRSTSQFLTFGSSLAYTPVHIGTRELLHLSATNGDVRPGFKPEYILTKIGGRVHTTLLYLSYRRWLTHD